MNIDPESPEKLERKNTNEIGNESIVMKET